MTKQLYSLPTLDTKSRQNFLALSKYSAQKKLRKAHYLGQEDVQLTPRTMNTQTSNGGMEKVKSPQRAQRQDSRMAEPGDTMSIQTPRIQSEDRTKSEPALLPPIEALQSIPDNEDGEEQEVMEGNGTATQSKGAFKLPVASRYQLYSIGLTYNAGKDKKERRAQKKPQTYREINSRRMKHKTRDEKMESVAPIKIPEEDNTFSIRKKIEQYRNWHEEQYRQKLKDLKSEVERERQAEILKIASLKNKSGVKKTTSIKMSHRSTSYDNVLPRLPAKNDHNFSSGLKEVDEEVVSAKEQEKTHPEIPESAPKETETENSAPEKAERVSSSKTWRTWRDVNDSYAYTDVKQYIKENELMDEEKEKYINEWIDQVGVVPDDIGTPTSLETDTVSGAAKDQSVSK